MPLNIEEMADNLRAYRAKARLSQDEVATVVGCNRMTIGNYENGKQVPQIDAICKLADLYGVSLDELAGFKHE